MAELAISGGAPEVKGQLAYFNRIGFPETKAARDAMQWNPLSGYLGGQLRGGRFVRELEETWAQRCNAHHAVACNSATSGLLAACAATGLGYGWRYLVPALTMSATAAAPAMLGATPIFGDVDSDVFCLNESLTDAELLITTDLFGHPAPFLKQRGIVTVVDAAQAPFARDCVGGDIDVYSLNVHKHIQCGEGGVCVTDDDDLAEAMRMFINHGEMAGKAAIGLNLRMTEVTAAIALAQLGRADGIIRDRIGLAESLTHAVMNLPGIFAPEVAPGCRHVYYIWAAKVPENRDWFVKAMNAEGVPLRAGYVDPLYRLPAFSQYARECPVAERLHDKELVIWENCAWDPTQEQIKQIGNAFAKVMEHAMQQQ